jgi:hypothetical protein
VIVQFFAGRAFHHFTDDLFRRLLSQRAVFCMTFRTVAFKV